MLGLWQCYRSLYGQCVTAVQKQEERADRLLRSATDREITEEESSAWIKDCNVSGDETLQHGWLACDHIGLCKPLNILFCSSLLMPKLSITLLLHSHFAQLGIYPRISPAIPQSPFQGIWE